MKVDKIQSNISGREQFNKLSDIEKATRLGIEQFRQHYNHQNFGHPIPAKTDALSQEVRFRVIIKNAMQKVLKNMLHK